MNGHTSRRRRISILAGLGIAALGLVVGPAVGPARAQEEGGGEHGDRTAETGHADPSDRAEEGRRRARGVELTVERHAEASRLTVRLGSLHLAAGADHHALPQPPVRFLEVPLDGWLTAYAPRLVDGGGEPVPGRLLHHVAFWNAGRSDFLCPNKEEHIFGAGGEMNEWVPLPGFGYPVSEGDRVRVTTMFHNPTDREYPEVHLEVDVDYRKPGTDGAVRDVYPAWFDVQECGLSGYDLEPGTNVTTGTIEVPVSGRLLGVGGHLHDHGKELVLERLGGPDGPTELARLEPETDEAGRILSMPVVPFLFQGGLPLRAGDVVRVTARYENPTGRRLPEGAMGIVVGYFLPDDPEAMARFRREGS